MHTERSVVKYFAFQLNIENFAFHMKRIIAISLLFIFLSGQVNLTWASHYCMGFNVKSSLMLGQGQLDCGMGAMMDCDTGEEKGQDPELTAPDCCSNEYASSDADDNFSKIDPITDLQVFFTISYVETLWSFDLQNDEHKYSIASSPPLIHTDRQVLYQSFLL